MRLLLKDDLPFTTMTIAYQGAVVEVPHVLIDTGSATTIVETDLVVSIQIVPLPHDLLKTIRGVGGTEVVFNRTVDYVQVGDCRLPNFSIDIGGMDYGFKINGILGMDFLMNAGAIINLRELSIEFANLQVGSFTGVGETVGDLTEPFDEEWEGEHD